MLLKSGEACRNMQRAMQPTNPSLFLAEEENMARRRHEAAERDCGDRLGNRDSGGSDDDDNDSLSLSVHIYEWVFNNSSRLAALFLHLNHACEGTLAPAERERIVRISNDFMQSAKGRRGNFVCVCVKNGK